MDTLNISSKHELSTKKLIRKRFGSSDFESLGLPGGGVVDKGLEDLAADKVTVESLLVSLAAPRLRREGVPVSNTLADPEIRLYDILSQENPDLAHHRYNAWRRQIVSFADACYLFRIK
jgi:hypothetical protein